MVAALAAVLPGGSAHRSSLHTFQRALRLRRGRFRQRATVKVDIVAGADGVHSVLQRAVVDAGAGVIRDHIAYRGLIPASRLQGWPDCLVTWRAGGQHLLAFPVRGGLLLLNHIDFVSAGERMRESCVDPGGPGDAGS